MMTLKSRFLRKGLLATAFGMLTLAGCGAPTQGEYGSRSDSSALMDAVSSQPASHEICGDDVNVRNSLLKEFSSASRGEPIRPSGKTQKRSSDGKVFLEVYFYLAPTGYGWVAQEFVCKLNGSGTGGGSIAPGKKKIVVSLASNTLTVFDGAGNAIAGFKDLPVVTGRAGKRTPPSFHYIVEDKEQCPQWTSPDTGQKIPGCASNNPLGTRWIQFNTESYGIHGTIFPDIVLRSNPESRRESNGCVRMLNSDVERVYNIVKTGDMIVIQ